MINIMFNRYGKSMLNDTIIETKNNYLFRTNQLPTYDQVYINYGQMEEMLISNPTADFLRGYMNGSIDILRNVRIPKRYTNGQPVVDNDGNPVILTFNVDSNDRITNSSFELKEIMYHFAVYDENEEDTIMTEEQLGSCIYHLRQRFKRNYTVRVRQNEEFATTLRQQYPHSEILPTIMGKYTDSFSAPAGLCAVFGILFALENIIPDNRFNNALETTTQTYFRFFDHPTDHNELTFETNGGTTNISIPTIYEARGDVEMAANHPMRMAFGVRELINELYFLMAAGEPLANIGLQGNYQRVNEPFENIINGLTEVMSTTNSNLKIIDIAVKDNPNISSDGGHGLTVIVRRRLDNNGTEIFSYGIVESNTGRITSIQNFNELNTIMRQIIDYHLPNVLDLDRMSAIELDIEKVYNRVIPELDNFTLSGIMNDPFCLYHKKLAGLQQEAKKKITLYRSGYDAATSSDSSSSSSESSDDEQMIRRRPSEVPISVLEEVEHNQESRVTEFQGRLREAVLELEKNSGIANLNNHRILYSEITTVVSNHDPITGNAEIKYEVPIQNMENNDRINVVIENDAMNGVKELLSAYSRSSYERSVENSVFTHPEDISNVSNISEHTGISSIGANNIPRGVTIERSPFSINPIHTLSYGFLFMTLLNSFSNDNS